MAWKVTAGRIERLRTEWPEGPALCRANEEGAGALAAAPAGAQPPIRFSVTSFPLELGAGWSTPPETPVNVEEC